MVLLSGSGFLSQIWIKKHQLTVGKAGYAESRLWIQAREQQESCLIDFCIGLPFARSPMVVFEVIGQLGSGSSVPS
ncbi:MAG: hypothetical protein ABWY12_18075 [Burkholderiales bacterium]